MPNVHPGKSPPPVSGTAEEKNDLQLSDQAAAEPQVAQSPPALIYSKTAADQNPLQTLLSPPPGRLTQQDLLLTVGVVQVNDTPENLHLEEICGEASADAARECSDERNREVVLKEIAFSSTAFIGPACRPEPAIEKELSDFYKELEELDHHDSVDGHPTDNEGVSQSVPAPAVNPSLRKEARADHKSACRPYPAARPQRDCGNNRNWRPHSHSDMKQDDSFNHQNQWQSPPPRLPHGPPGIQFQEPWHVFPRPPAENPVQHLNLQHPFNDYSPADGSSWSSRAGPCFSLGYDIRLSSSTCSGSLEERGRSSNDRRHHVGQNCHERNQYHSYHVQNQYQHNSDVCLVLVLMRGAPGSGKSTLAREILSGGPRGLILSTDDFFQENGYSFDPALLGDAHEWNQGRARNAMSEQRSPVIIDNTNVQAWEMKPYVKLALDHGYRVEFVEPDTRWRYDPTELEKRNRHGVPRRTIEKMLQRFEAVSVEAVLNSWEPPEKNRERLSRPHAQRRSDYSFIT